MPPQIPFPEAGDPRPAFYRLLTLDEINRATAWVNEKAARAGDPCQVCDSQHSLVQPSLGAMPGGLSPFDGVTSWIHPCVIVVCQNCGFIRYFNAITVGLVEGYSPPEEAADA